MTDLVGRTLSHYRITSAIGAGGMGEVYRATDTTLGRDVAIKVLPPEVAQDGERLGRFRREAHLLASLNHPNIAAIYGLEETDGQPSDGGQAGSDRHRRGDMDQQLLVGLVLGLVRRPAGVAVGTTGRGPARVVRQRRKAARHAR